MKSKERILEKLIENQETQNSFQDRDDYMTNNAWINCLQWVLSD